MKPSIAWIALVLAGCQGAPEPYPLLDLERRDFRSVSAPGPARPDELLSKDEYSLADVLAIADAMNPELAAERQKTDLATAEVWEARLHPNPSLLLEVEDYRTRDGLTTGKMERSAGVSIPLILSGRIGKATRLAESERDEAALSYLWRRREILSEVKRAFVSLLVSRKALELSLESRDLAKTVRDVSEERLRAQAVPEMELLKASVSLAKAEIDLKSAEKEARLALKTLHTLMGNVDFPKDRFTGSLSSRFATSSFEALRGFVAASHPLIEASLKAREAAEWDLALAKAQRFPDPELQITAGLDPEDHSIIEGGFSIPFPLFNRNQARIARAETRIRQASLKTDSLRNDLILRLAEAHGTFTASQDRVATYQDEILPKAEKALLQTQEGYGLGKFGYLDLLDAQRTWTEARTAHTAALSDLNLAVVELEKLTGSELKPIRQE